MSIFFVLFMLFLLVLLLLSFSYLLFLDFLLCFRFPHLASNSGAQQPSSSIIIYKRLFDSTERCATNCNCNLNGADIEQIYDIKNQKTSFCPFFILVHISFFK